MSRNRRQQPSHLPTLADLLHVRPATGRWPIALQAGLAVATPVAIASLLGQTGLGLMMGLGIFAVLYATTETIGPRLRTTAGVSLGLVACAAIGVLVHAHPWLHLLSMVGVSALAAGICRALHVGPPGAYFFPLVCGVSGFIAARQPPLRVLLLTIAGTAVALVVALLGSALKPPSRGAHRDHRPHLKDRRETEAIAVRVALATLLAGLVALLVGVSHSYWAVASAMLVLHQGGRARDQLVRGLQRLVGTLLGLGVYALLVWWGPRGLWLAAVMFLLQFVIEMLVVRNYGAATVFITPLALTIAGAAGGGSHRGILLERGLDTLFGVSIALFVLGLWRWRSHGVWLAPIRPRG